MSKVTNRYEAARRVDRLERIAFTTFAAAAVLVLALCGVLGVMCALGASADSPAVERVITAFMVAATLPAAAGLGALVRLAHA